MCTLAGRLWSLEGQIGHLQDFLREQVLLPNKPPVIVMGHSIGAYMCVKGIQRLEQELSASKLRSQALPPVLKVFALFPFFQTDFNHPRNGKRQR